MIIALLQNPGSGDGEAERVADLLSERGAEVHSFELSEAGVEVVRDCGAERIAIAGGDGSIGLAAGIASELDLELGVIPVGTANDFAKALELPDDTEDACEVVATGTRTRRLDLAKVGDRYFVNAASLGLAPAAAQKAEAVKEALGKFAYGVGALQAAASEDPVECTVSGDDEEIFTGECWQVIIGSMGAFGGGSDIDSEPTDGMLDVVVIEAGPRARLARHAVGLRVGQVEDQPGVVSQRAREVRVEVADGAAFNVDGEVLELGPSTFTAQPDAVSVVIG